MNPTTNTEAGAVADVAAKLTDLELDLVLNRASNWGSWMWAVAHDLCSKGVMRKVSATDIQFTDFGALVRQHLGQGATAGVAEMNEQMFGQGNK